MILKFCVLAFAGTLLFCVAFYNSINRDIGSGYVQALDSMKLISNGLMQNYLFTQGAVIALVGLLVILFTLLMSHRIAGPLYRIELSLKAAGQGQLNQRIHLREKDEMINLAEQVNGMVLGLNTKLTDIKSKHRLLERDLGLLLERYENLPAEDCLIHAKDLLATSNELLARIEEVKTK
jgi:nitrogen fixation/metabolism regulation signal transduction histidine kinase